MALVSVIRRWHLRDGMPIREIAHHTGLSRNTVRKCLASQELESPEQSVGSVGPDALRHARGKFGSALVRSSVSRKPLRFLSLLRYHTEIALHQVRHTLGFGYRR